MRLFVAIHFSEDVKRVLLNVIGQLREQAAGGNYTRPENLHLTLAFIGESEDVAAIKEAMDGCEGPGFDLTVGGFGHFGSLYWVGIRKAPALAALAEELQNALRQRGFPIEERPFKPHITVGREIRTKGPLRVDVPETTMRADRISLMKSERINGKLTYTEVYGRALE